MSSQGPVSPSEQQSETQRSSNDFRQWVTSLTSEDLLQTLACDVRDDEYSLWKDLVRLHRPSSPPVHPRAMGYRPVASQRGAHLDSDSTRVRKPAPRLFQWTCRDSILCNADPRPGSNSTRRQRKHRNGIAMSGGTNGTTPTKLYEVIGRKFVTSDGQELSIPSTHDQQIADEWLIDHAAFNIESSKTADRQSIRHLRIHIPSATIPTDCKHICAPPYKDDTPSAQQILQYLQIASRGNLYNPPNAHVNSEIIPFEVDWFHPTEVWVSLSKCLACRFHQTLWHRFHNQTTWISVRMETIQYDFLLQKVMPEAMRSAILSTLKLEGSSDLSSLRDSTIWMLLNRMNASSELTSFPLEWCYKHWQHLPVSCVGSKWEIFRDQVGKALEQAIATQMQEALLKDSGEGQGSDNNLNSTNYTKKSSASKSRKKKNRRRKKVSVVTRKHMSMIPTVPEEDDAHDDVHDDDRNEDDATHNLNSNSAHLSISKKNFVWEFPTGAASARERNQNIVTVLSILERDVLERVFQKIGLAPTPTDAQKIEDASFLTLKKGKPVPKTAAKPKQSSQPIILRPRPVQSNKRKVTPVPTAKKIFVRPIPSKKQTPTANSQKQKTKAHAAAPQTTNLHSSIDWPLLPATGDTDPSPEGDPGLTWNSQVNPFSPTSTNTAFSQLSTDFFRPPAQVSTSKNPTVDYAFGMLNDQSSGSEVDWPFVNRYAERENSILAEFFLSQQKKVDDIENLMAASTAASIASSTYKEVAAEMETDGDDGSKLDEIMALDHQIEDAEDEIELVDAIEHLDKTSQPDYNNSTSLASVPTDPSSLQSEPHVIIEVDGEDEDDNNHFDALGSVPAAKSEEEVKARDTLVISPKRSTPSPISLDCRSPSPQAPITPPPTLSPILVSLADLQTLKRSVSLTPERLKNIAKVRTTSYSAVASGSLPGSLPSSPVQSQPNLLKQNWSRKDLKMSSFRDDHNLRSRRPPRLLEHQGSYRASAMKALIVKPTAAKPIKSSKIGLNLPFLEAVRKSTSRESCAQSETAVEGLAQDQHWHQEFRRPHLSSMADDRSIARDETTTITSALSQREPEENCTLREERNGFRDMCLTLGAEVAKLKSMLATQQAAPAVHPTMDYTTNGFNQAPMYVPTYVDPHGMPPFFHGMHHRGKRLGPMSDAGIHRPFDHESQVSEDDTYDVRSRSRADTLRGLSSSHTITGSDASAEPNSSAIKNLSNPQAGASIGLVPINDPLILSSHGLQSRLTKDIFRFLNSTNTQLRKQENRRRMAVERFTRFVNTLWPRAQVKLYGSHVSGLCLPSSDLDFVVCLPAVHKNAPALAPGVLEGRNAINETSQKLMARQLKGESWIDPRSIKLIERTVVPVIKVSTKDTRAKMLQLDVSFDSPEHHGLDANAMVAQILEQTPMIRPLVLVLKQLLLDRGLLTAYTGGLSSYCLFLMVARYLQDQPTGNVGDCGSLFMGFLDFYGNCFDPRATGISVRCQQYFARPWHSAPHAQGQTDFLRRNSFSDTNGVNIPASRAAPRYKKQQQQQQQQQFSNNSNANVNNNNNGGGGNLDHTNRPFTFDPLFVEDPLSAGNNVGRNAFRIFQVQRAFSDAHRALMASLEWDSHSTGGIPGEDENNSHNAGSDDVGGGADSYPLLKCLLQSEDVLYEL